MSPELRGVCGWLLAFAFVAAVGQGVVIGLLMDISQVLRGLD